MSALHPSSSKRSRTDGTDVDDLIPAASPISKAQKLLSTNTNSNPQLICTLPPTCHPPHNRPFHLANTQELESHYAKYHAFVCEVAGCGAIFPGSRLLELHQTECHDTFALMRKERGEKIFACHLDTCPKVCVDPKRRRLHLIEAHGFPKEYYFSVTNKGVGHLLKRWGEGASMIRKPWKPREGQKGDESGDEFEGEDDEIFLNRAEEDGSVSTVRDAPSAGTIHGHKEAQEAINAGKQKSDVMDGLEESMSSLSLIPSSVRFGRGAKSSRGTGPRNRGGTPGQRGRGRPEQLPAASKQMNYMTSHSSPISSNSGNEETLYYDKGPDSTVLGRGFVRGYGGNRGRNSGRGSGSRGRG